MLGRDKPLTFIGGFFWRGLKPREIREGPALGRALRKFLIPPDATHIGVKGLIVVAAVAGAQNHVPRVVAVV